MVNWKSHRTKSIKSGLFIEITEATCRPGLTLPSSAQRIGVFQPKVSAALNQDFATAGNTGYLMSDSPYVRLLPNAVIATIEISAR